MASKSSSPQTFLVGSIPVTTNVTTTTIIPTISQSPPQSPQSSTKPSSSSSPSRTPSPPKRKPKTKRKAVLNPQPISMISPSKKSQTSTSIVIQYPLQKDTEYKTTFAPADIPKHDNFSVKVTPVDIKLGSNNFRAPDTIPEGSEGYHPIFNYLWNSPVADALSISSSKHYHHLLQEFWWTATYDDSTRCIEGTVLRGTKDISIDADVIRKVLKLDYLNKNERYVKPATTEEWKAMLEDCGYNYSVKDEAERFISTNPLRARLPGVYHYLLANII